MRPTKSRSGLLALRTATCRATGRPAAFIFAVVVILAWLVTGPVFRCGDTWQLVTNTGTTIITCLMVFLIQNTQDRAAEALQVKLGELLRATAGAHNALLDPARTRPDARWLRALGGECQGGPAAGTARRWRA